MDLEIIKKRFYNIDGYKLNIGCGYYSQSDYIGLDNGIGFNSQIPEMGRKPDIFIDLCNEKWPFEDKTVKEIYCSHAFEHFNNIDYIIIQSARVLKKNGLFIIIIPYANSAEGMYPGHNIFFTEKWFKENILINKFFDITYTKFYPSDYYNNLSNDSFIKKNFLFDEAKIFFYNVCNQMEIHLKLK